MQSGDGTDLGDDAGTGGRSAEEAGGRVHEPDPETIRAAARGDVAAFEELMCGYQAHIWRFLRHLVADAALAEDLTQETFVRVYRRLGGFRFQSRFSAWIFRIARNVGIDALRARERRGQLVDRLAAPAPVADASTRTEIAAGLASLSPHLREAFVLVEVFGLRYREAALVIGAPEGTIKSRVFRARSNLIAWLSADDEIGRADEL